jgi:hypothetical protein
MDTSLKNFEEKALYNIFVKKHYGQKEMVKHIEGPSL